MATPPAGVINYWAAARAAAGTAQESFQAATLAEALAAASQRHGAELARVLARCSFVVDGDPVGTRPHDKLILADGATIDVLPPFAGGSEAAAPVLRPLGPPRRPLPGTLIAVGGCVLLLLASWGGRPMLGGALLLLQLLLVIGWFRLASLRTPGQAAGAVAAVLAAAAADIALLDEVDDASVRPLTVVLAALVVAAFVVQLARRDGRDRLTDALSATVGAGALCLTMASLLGVRGAESGAVVVAVAVGAVGAALVIVAGVLMLPFWPSATRPVAVAAALALGLGVGTGVAALIGSAGHGVGTGAAAAIGAAATALALSAVALIAAAGLATNASAAADTSQGADAEQQAGADQRSRAGRIRPITATVPLAVIGPAVLIIARIMVG
jgi:molybdopterin synthase sulfur carrier subunit